VIVRQFSQDVKQPLAYREVSLGRLEKAIRTLGQAKPAKPPSRTEEYIRQWQDYLAGRRHRLERRAVRYLCWEPDVATHSRFQTYLDQEYADMSPRWLQGLVRSCHSRWSSDFAAGSVVKGVRRRLESYQGPNHLLLRWKNASAMILGTQGPTEFSAYLLKNLQTIKACCEGWGVDEQSPFILVAVRQAAQRCRENMRQNGTYTQYLLEQILPWSHWPLQDFKDVIGKTILHRAASEISESLTSFVLRDHRLGDPRLSRNARNWLGLPEDVRLRFIQWLSRTDIVFFFEHVLPDRVDPHGRKMFWLRYVPRLRMSRPLLYEYDAARLRMTMQRMGEQVGHFGRVRGRGQTSAFLLDFGVLLVVEFSAVGNAAYVYEKRATREVIADFWAPRPFNDSQLKQRQLCLERVVHRPGWQGEMAGILARYGIRPG
jgi:hypothetical protein